MTDSNGKTGLFGKRGRPSPLPLNRLRNGEENNLPPYSPYSAGGGQSPYVMQNNMTPAYLLQQSASHGGEGGAASEKQGGAQDEVPATPFSPFAPFTPVPPAPQSGTPGQYTFPPSTRSSLYHSSVLPPPSPAPYIDPEAAQAMGIHKSVLDQAESGVSEDEIEKRRARAQRRLERRQRAEEGSIVEHDTVSEAPSFRQLARERQV